MQGNLSCKQQFTKGGRDVEIGFRRFGGTPGEIATFRALTDAAKKIAGPDISFTGSAAERRPGYFHGHKYTIFIYPG